MKKALRVVSWLLVGKGLTSLAQQPAPTPTRPPFVPQGTALHNNGGLSAPPKPTPAPSRIVEGREFSLAELNQTRSQFEGRIVLLKTIALKVLPRYLPNGEFHVYVADDQPVSGRPLDYLIFPPDGAQKMGFLRSPIRREISCYVFVSRMDLRAIGTHYAISPSAGKASFKW